MNHKAQNPWIGAGVLGAACLMVGGRLFAAPDYHVTVDFESGGYTLAADGGGSSTLSTDQANSPTRSAKFVLPNTVTDFSKVVIDVAPGDLQLKDGTGTFQTYVPSGNADYIPYMYFGVDTDQNGTFSFGTDSFVIAFFSQSAAYDSWAQSGIGFGTKVHVVGARPNLTAGTYSSSGTQDTLGNLSALSTGSGLWGNLDILQIRVGAGETGGNVGPYTAYVDDIDVVPEPAGLSLLGLGGLAVMRRRRRRI